MCVKAGSSNAYGLQIRWAATDLPNLQTDPMRALITSTSSLRSSVPSSPTSAVHSTSRPISTASSAEASRKPGGSTDSFPFYAKIGVGAGLGLLLILTAISTCIIVRRRKKQKTIDQETPTASDESPGPGEANNHEKATFLHVQEPERHQRSSSMASKRSSRSRTNSNLATVSEETADWKRGHISWQPEIQQRHSVSSEPFPPELALALLEGEPSRRRMSNDPSSPVSAVTSPQKSHSKRASPERDVSRAKVVSRKAQSRGVSPERGRRKDVAARVSRSGPASPAGGRQTDTIGRAPSVPRLDFTGMGTTVTPDVDPDQFYTLDSTWHTFFDATPSATPGPPERSLARGPSSRPTTSYETQASSSSDPTPSDVVREERPITADEEYEQLKMQRASIEDKKLRLLQLHQLDDELDRVNLRIQRHESKKRTRSLVNG
jgi:hypothetical protein